jgi:hypothetical protein
MNTIESKMCRDPRCNRMADYEVYDKHGKVITYRCIQHVAKATLIDGHGARTLSSSPTGESK